MHKGRQFQTAAQRRTFFDRKVLKYGHSRSLSLGKILPKTWDYVRLRITEQTETHITLSIELLWRDASDPRNTKANQTSGQNT